MAKTEAELAKAAEDLTDAALALKATLDVARRQRRRDRIYLGFAVLLLALTLLQSRQNGEVLKLVKESTSPERQRESEERIAGAIDEIERRLTVVLDQAIGEVLCEVGVRECP